jgi:hypothetical protein
MCDIPIPVSDAETIVRALFESHVNKRKDKLRDSVFRPKPGTDSVSVMRHTYMKSHACKAKAKQIAADPTNPYVGLAAITVKAVRRLGSDVVDSREEFCGHADISHGIVVPADEPPDPVLTLRIRALRENARLFIDPDPTIEEWSGEQVDLPG